MATKGQTMRQFVLLLAMVIFANMASPVRSSDLLSTSAWRFLYVDYNGDAVEQALTDAGFFENWMLPEYDEADVASYQWQDGTAPIGYGIFLDTELLNTILPSTVDNKGLFLRGTFDVPPDSTGSFQFDLRTIGERATVFFNGEEVSSEVNPVAEPKDTSLTFDVLFPGTHTLAVAVESLFDHAMFDARLTSLQAMERTFVNNQFSRWSFAENWVPVGVPEPNDIVVIPADQLLRIDRPSVSVGGLRLGPNAVLDNDWDMFRPTVFPTIILNGPNAIVSSEGSNRFRELMLDVRSDIVVEVLPDGILHFEELVQLNEFELSTNGNVILNNIQGTGAVNVLAGDLRISGEVGALQTPVDSTVFLDQLIPVRDPWQGSIRSSLLPELNVQGDASIGSARLGLFRRSNGSIGTLSTAHSRIAGEGGDLVVESFELDSVSELVVRGQEFRFFPGWNSVSITTWSVPSIDGVEWDTSDMDRGILRAVDNSEAPACDANLDGVCDVIDLDLLGSVIFNRGYSTSMDMNDDGVLDLLDRDRWLAEVGIAEIGVPFLPGDANLDGFIDTRDLNPVGFSWQQCSGIGWDWGDYDFDDCVTALDLNYVGVNWQHGHVANNAAPEPGGWLLACFAACFLWRKSATTFFDVSKR